MNRPSIVEITKPMQVKILDSYLSSKVQDFLGVKWNEIIVLYRDYEPVSSRAASCAIFTLISDNYTIVKTSGGNAEELPFPVIYDQTSSSRTSPYSAVYFLTDKSGNKLTIRLKLSSAQFEQSFVQIYLPARQIDLGRQFFNDLEKRLASLSDLRLNGAGDFLELAQPLTDEDLVLPAEIKQALKSNVIGFIEKYKESCKTHTNGEFNIIKRGVLLFGAPGTGKSLTIRWLMSVLRCNFIIATGKHLKRSDDVSEIFNLARLIKPVVVVLEDLDLYGLSRDGGYFAGQILNELLNQLDGSQHNMSGIVTIGTANKTDVLDKALTKRPGRFDVILHYKNPTFTERTNLLKLNLSKTKPDHSIDIAHIAGITDGFSPAQIVEVVKRAVILVSEQEGTAISQADLISAVNQLKEPTKEIGFKRVKGQTE